MTDITATDIDLSHPSSHKNDVIFTSVNTAFSKLKFEYPEIVLDIYRLMMPGAQDSQPLGKYHGFSPGLPNPALGGKSVRDVMVNKLLESMGESERYRAWASNTSGVLR